MQFQPSFHRLLVASVSAVALQTGAVRAQTPANSVPGAREATSQPAARPAAQTVTVTGLRAANTRQIRLRRNSAQIIDSVTTTEIGQLPDFNAGDALKRVAGVNTLSYQGEPRFVVVRGFDENYNDFLIDGFKFASTDINTGSSTNGRQIDMSLLPSNIASHIDVIKSAIPSADANFIGGLTNFVTPSAMDNTKDSLSFSARGGAALQSGHSGGSKPTGDASLAGSKRFGADRQFGFYGSATYWSRDINVPQLEAGGTQNFYLPNGKQTGAYGGNAIAVPSSRTAYNYINHRERYGLQARLDWEPTDLISASLSSYYFHQTERSYRNDLNAVTTTTTQDLHQTANSGTLTNVTQNTQLGRLRWDRQVYGVYGRAKADLAHGFSVDEGSSWSQSVVNSPQVWDQFAQSGLSYSYVNTSNGPVFTPVDASKANNASLYKLVSHRNERYRLRENDFDQQFNVSNNTAIEDRGFGVQGGARVNATFQADSFDREIYTGNSYTLANVLSGDTLCGYGCSTAIPVISPSAASNAFQTNQGKLKGTRDTTSIYGGTYSAYELVMAGYAQAQYRANGWYAVGGVRVERTNSSSTGYQSTNGVYGLKTAGQNYTNALPSMLVEINTTRDSKLRLGYGETLARPTFSQSAIHGGVLVSNSTPPTLSTGNPALQPRESTNFDIAEDFYLDHNRGLFTVSGFSKLIRHEIYTSGSFETVSGVSVPVLVTQARNSNQLAHVLGLEANFIYNLNFLAPPFDGLAVSANATISRSRLPITLNDGSHVTMNGLPEQPNQIYNVSLIYEKGRYHGRIAWNHLGRLWDDRYPNFSASGYYANRFQQPTDNLDLQVAYDVSKRATLTFDAQNVTAQGMRYQYGQGQSLYQSAWSLPTIVLAGIRLRM